MERLWTVIPLAALLSAGCMGTSKSWMKPINDVTHAVQKAIEPEKPPLATNFACAWANRLQQLNDPAHGGRMVSGVVGQVFLYSDDMKPAEIQGELTVMVTDASTVAKPPHTPEVWHFKNETLRKMVVHDDRYGLSVAAFLPWPPEWRDVNRIVVQARYDQPGAEPLYSKQATITLDLSNSGGASAGGVVPNSTASQMEVPNPAKALRAAQHAVPLPQWNAPQSPVVPAGNTVPVQTQPAVNPQQPQMPPVEFPRTVIRR